MRISHPCALFKALPLKIRITAELIAALESEFAAAGILVERGLLGLRFAHLLEKGGAR